jgi:hypothetical protein
MTVGTTGTRNANRATARATVIATFVLRFMPVVGSAKPDIRLVNRTA